MSGFTYRLERHSAPHAAKDSTLVAAVAHIFSHSFGTNPKTGQPYRLGPKTTRERLQGTTDLIIGFEDSTSSAMGYIYGRTIESPQGLMVWIDSLAVEPEHRRKGLGTKLVSTLILAHASCRWVGWAARRQIQSPLWSLREQLVVIHTLENVRLRLNSFR